MAVYMPSLLGCEVRCELGYIIAQAQVGVFSIQMRNALHGLIRQVRSTGVPLPPVFPNLCLSSEQIVLRGPVVVARQRAVKKVYGSRKISPGK
jgi:hypothetical protein